MSVAGAWGSTSSAINRRCEMADQTMKKADERDEKNTLEIEDLPAQAVTPREEVELKGGTSKPHYKDPETTIGTRSSRT
jgi:hypothetical protein